MGGSASVDLVLKDIEDKIQETGTPADDGSFASGHQKGMIDGLESAKLIVLKLKNQEEHIQFNRLKALSRKEARENTELSREDKILGLMKYYGISRRKAIAELEDSGDL